ncbi:hypothetical protein [Thermosediminibacter litoriperuensis]|uniref:UbiA prenyltransferase family protein n=1 Tax=Thermosediminibacter litoriperuensis TaxID=291989 RepID=A0A5S5AF73_9FIRM|nr:hypothetical protein [Thermosediminibacter litoriperuensis]TYP48690.1 hypothetical protein LZ11_02295 [Thermosediminibacter litoriperuensis]
MWHIMSNPVVKKALAVFLTGVVIKMTDDFNDHEYDILVGKRSLIDVLKTGAFPYAIVVFSLACLLELNTSISLFYSSFIIGMATNLNARMPSGLYGYQESFLMFFTGILILGHLEMLSSLLTISAVQFWDDWRDYREDAIARKNLANALGKGECILLSIICLLAAYYMDPVKATAAAFSTLSIVYIIKLLLICHGEVSDNI